MTGELQVIDLFVNGPLKAAIRRRGRCLALHANFLEWKAEWKAELSKPAAMRVMKPFSPPAPFGRSAYTFQDLRERLPKGHLKEGLQKAFVNVGLAQDTTMTEPFFRKYRGNGRKGTIARALVSADDTKDAVVFGQLAVQLNMEARPVSTDDAEETRTTLRMLRTPGPLPVLGPLPGPLLEPGPLPALGPLLGPLPVLGPLLGPLLELLGPLLELPGPLLELPEQPNLLGPKKHELDFRPNT